MHWLYESLKHQALVQLKSGVSARNVADSFGMSLSSIAHMRGEIIGEIEKQRGGRPKVLGEQEKQLGVHLVTTSHFKTASAAAKHHFEMCFERSWFGCLCATKNLYLPKDMIMRG